MRVCVCARSRVRPVVAVVVADVARIGYACLCVYVNVCRAIREKVSLTSINVWKMHVFLLVIQDRIETRAHVHTYGSHTRAMRVLVYRTVTACENTLHYIHNANRERVAPTEC